MGRNNASQREPQFGCNGKKVFLTFTKARQAAERTMRAKGREGEHMQAYHCPDCQKFHVGSESLRRAQRIKLRVIR